VTVDNSDTTTEYDYNERGWLMSSVEESASAEKATAFSYDSTGSQTSKLISIISDAPGDENISLVQQGYGDGCDITYEISGYDRFGRLASAYNDNYAAEYAYNADGLRVSKSVTKDGITTTAKFLYEGGYVTLEMDGLSAQIAYNVYGEGSVISRKTAQGTAYYVYNGHGDVVQLTDAWGAVTASYDYDAFGNLINETGNGQNPFRYCGEYLDLSSGTYYLRARYYDPEIGRFTQRDAFLGSYADPLSLNRYTYCHNNPIRYIDPTGHIKEDDAKNLNAAGLQLVQVLTSEYYATNDRAEREAISKKADAIRADPNYQANSKKQSNIPAADAKQAAAIMDASLKQWASNNGGALTAAQWDAILSAAPYGGVSSSSSFNRTTEVRTTTLTYVGTVVTSTYTPRLYPIESKISITKAANPSFWTNAEIFNSYDKGYQWFRDDERVFMAASQMAWELERGSTDISQIRRYNQIILVQHLANAKRTGAIDSQTYNSVGTVLTMNGQSFDGYIDLARFQSLVKNETAQTDWAKGLDKYLDIFSVADFMDCVMLFKFVSASVQLRGAGYNTLDTREGGYQSPNGGGGVTNSIKTGNGTVTFGHGGRHFPGANISAIEQTIANNIPKLNSGQFYKGVVNVNGMKIEFHAYCLSEGVTNVGTYFIIP